MRTPMQVREKSGSEDATVLREAIGKLSNASMKIGEALNQQTSSGSDGSSSGGSSSQ